VNKNSYNKPYTLQDANNFRQKKSEATEDAAFETTKTMLVMM